MIPIDKNVPVPVPKTRQHGGLRGTKYNWNEMQPGDSFFAPGMFTDPKKGRPVMRTENGRKIHPDSTWMTRSVTEKGVAGVRVWRLS